MKAKALEIRDKGTFIAALAVDMNPCFEEPQRNAQFWLLSRCGYRCDGRPNIMLTNLDGDGTMATNDPYAWRGRTFPTAHSYIIDHWDELEDGSVVDVQFLLGETTEPKRSERESVHG